MKRTELRIALGGFGTALLCAPAGAFDFKLGENGDIQGSWNTTIAAGAAWRMQNRDPALYNPENGDRLGLPTGLGGNADDGELNYGKGDAFISGVRFVSDLALQKGSLGGAISFRGWYDLTQSRSGVPHGNEANNYVAGLPLSDRGAEPLARFGGAYLLNLYAFNTWQLDDGNALYASVGRQVINWGKGLFLQGVDQINPLDVNALRRPGTQVKDALVPAAFLYGKLDLAASQTTLEGFYQFQWEPSALEACGTYFTSIDNNIGPNTAGSGCPSAIVKAPDATGYPARLFVPLLPTTTPRHGGQFGVSLRQFVEPLQTEFAFYAMNIHSRTVVLNGIRGEVTFQAEADATGKPNVKGRWVYPENVQYYGVSAATRLAGWALGAELSHTPNLPVQVAVGDAIAAMLYPTLGVPSQYWGPLGPRMLATPVGGEMRGYDRARKTMLLLNGVRSFQGVIGAQALTVAGEAGFSWAGGLNPGLRYGRGFVFGTARSPSYGPYNTVVAGDCPLLNTPNQPGCAPEGFATGFAWGYRLRAQLNYANVCDSGITISPNLLWLQDVKGTSVDYQFNQGRRTLGLGVNFAYRDRVNAALLYTWYGDGAQWNPTRDRDYLGAAVSVSF
jgi:hypothetical protein